MTDQAKADKTKTVTLNYQGDGKYEFVPKKGKVKVKPNQTLEVIFLAGEKVDRFKEILFYKDEKKKDRVDPETEGITVQQALVVTQTNTNPGPGAIDYYYTLKFVSESGNTHKADPLWEDEAP